MVRQSSALQLRPYQQDCLDAIAEAYFSTDHDTAAWRQLVAMATGLGKTVVLASLPAHARIDQWLNTFPVHQQKMLIIAHREELLDQAAATVAKANPHLMVEIEQASRRASPMADVVIASVQTLAMRAGKRMDKFDPDDFRLVIVDEAHHATASSYVKVLQYFGFLPPDDWQLDTKPTDQASNDAKLLWQRERLALWDAQCRPNRLLLGVTATPKRGDNIGLEAVFQRVVFSRNIRDGIDDGYLCRLRAFRAESDVSLDSVRTLAGDFNVGELATAIDTSARNALAVKAWQKHASDRKTIAFCASVEHAQHLAREFQLAGIAAQPISGATPSDERRQLLRDFSTGAIQVLTNCNLLTEGFDERNVGCVLHTRPTKSSLLYIQMTGRGTRTAANKEDCIIIDVVDLTRRHSLVTAPELVGLPSGFDVKGGDLLTAAKQVNDAKERHAQIDLANLKSLDDMRARISEVSLWTQVDNPELSDFTSMIWVKDDESSYRLSYPVQPNMEPEFIEASINALGQWDVSLHQGTQVKRMFVGLEREAAFRNAEEWLRRKRPHSVYVVDRGAAWRNEPATINQLAMIARLGIPVDPSRINKGQASVLISRFQSGKFKRR